MILEPHFFIWIGAIISLLLLLIVLWEIHRSNEFRENEEMFGSDAFDSQVIAFHLTDKERRTMEKLVRRSIFSNKDALFNSANLFEDAVNRFYEFRKLDGIRDITLDSVTELRKKLGFTISHEGAPFVSTRQFEAGSFIRVLSPEKKEIALTISRVEEKLFVIDFKGSPPDWIRRGDKLTLRWTRPGEAIYTVHPQVLMIGKRRVAFSHETKIEKFQLRRWVRENVDFELQALLTSGKIVSGRLLDLSAGGILLGLSEMFDEGIEIEIRFTLPSYGEERVKIHILRHLSRKIEKYPDLHLYTGYFAGEFGWTQEKVLQYIFELRREKRRAKMEISI